MNTLPSSRSAKKLPQLALRFGASPDGASNWSDGCGISYLGRQIILRLSTQQDGAGLNGDELHLPLPPEASARQIQDSAEAWLRQQCVSYVETMLTRLPERQLVLMKQEQRQETTSDKTVAQETRSASSRVMTRRVTIQLSFAARSPWIAAEDADTLRCNWRLIELAPAVIDQHLLKALGQLATLRTTNTTTDMFGALPA